MTSHSTTTFPLSPQAHRDHRCIVQLMIDVEYDTSKVPIDEQESVRNALFAALEDLPRRTAERGEFTGDTEAQLVHYDSRLSTAANRIRLVEPGGPAYVTNGAYALRATSRWTHLGQERMCYVWRGDHPGRDHIAAFPLNGGGEPIRTPDHLARPEREAVLRLVRDVRTYLPTIPMDSGRLTPTGLIASLIEASAQHGAATAHLESEIGDLADVLRTIATYLTSDQVLAIYFDSAIQTFLAKQLPLADPLHPRSGNGG